MRSDRFIVGEAEFLDTDGHTGSFSPGSVPGDIRPNRAAPRRNDDRPLIGTRERFDVRARVCRVDGSLRRFG
ncbi:hypothetical protein BRD05_00030 [Halobacteriales archaeon QS_9_70_65]|nr:MAG: hypothetical protein BRD05_00030 [Halobacteriales archaeon QS_9_70_65]